MTCEEARARLEAWLDGELEPAAAAALEAHLAACAPCAARARAGRALRERIAAAGRETAPEPLRRRVEGILAGAGETRAPDRRGRVAAAVLAVAAAVALLLLARPGAGPPGTLAAEGFASDHVAHAETAPSAMPFPPGADPPRPAVTAGARVEGLSRCVVDGRAYAHWVVRQGRDRISIFLPLEPTPAAERTAARVDGVAVVAVPGETGTAAVLVSSDLGPEELSARWGG